MPSSRRGIARALRGTSLSFGAAMIVALSLAAPAHAGTYSFHAVADARVMQAYPSTNYGSLRIFAQRSPTVRSYLRFNLSGISGTVTSAKLKIWPNSASSDGFVVHGAPSTWSENTLTWANAPAVGPAVSSVGAYSCCSGYVSADATPLVTGNESVTTVLTSTSAHGDQYRAREWGSSYWPLLVATTPR